jgi:phosphate acyltransferase
MGGDIGPRVTIPACLSALKKYPQLKLIVVGVQSALEHVLETHDYDTNRLQLVNASQQVEMDELPSHALRNKKDSSMRIALNLVKDNLAAACVSAGNTGALMATARFVLKTIPGIDRPAIISAFPTYNMHKNLRVLDLGANVDSSAEHLLQFAVMGSVLTEAVDNIPNPSVYLLNIGEEEIKGNEQVKKTAQLLTHLKIINYKGYIEADAIFQGEADVVVCDGFVGNVALKTTEGVSVFISKLIKESFMSNLWSQLVGLLVKPVMKPVVKRIDKDRYNGATLIGLKGIVIKSHGSANVVAFTRAIEEAVVEVEKNVVERIQNRVEELMKFSSIQDEPPP